MRARETASFRRENVIAVAILPRVLARMLWWRKQVHPIFKGFIILLSVEGLASFNRDNSAISLVKKKNKQWRFPGCLIREYAKKPYVKSRTRSRSRPRIWRSAIRVEEPTILTWRVGVGRWWVFGGEIFFFVFYECDRVCFLIFDTNIRL